ncbi:MAG: IS21 family transposase [Deltaproteobacteria bacterium]|nr:IS21 family transposase [Deltaproteobacteria bacterium]
MMRRLKDMMDMVALKRQGLSERQIARRLGMSRKTVHKYLEDPGAIERGRRPVERESKLDPYEGNLRAWLKEDPEYKATWIYDHLRPMGYAGGYDLVKVKVHELKEESQRIAYMRFETEPGGQAQVDFGEFQVVREDGTVGKYYLFSMILGYSRKIYAEFIEHCDLPTFLDCHIRAFAFFGGVPGEILYDRMRNVYIGRVAGKSMFNATVQGFAVHYGFTPRVAPAYAAWVKGKVERPFAFIREGFWRGYGFTCIETANRDLREWLAMKDERVHGTTHEVVRVRFERELPYLQPMPLRPFDTSCRVYRKVHKDCTVRFEGNSYVVAHTLVGKSIVLRVKDNIIRVFADNLHIVTYEIPEGRGHLVQDKRFYEALRKDRLMNARKYHHGRPAKGRAKLTISPVKPRYDMDVQIRPISDYDHAVECTL